LCILPGKNAAHKYRSVPLFFSGDYPMPQPLSHITIASPCSADWNAMQGDDQVRFCQQCQLNVYNLSGMSRSAAEMLIQQTEGRLCVRFYQRHDGTVITQDCPVGLQAIHRRKLSSRKNNQWRHVAAAITLITAAGAFWVTAEAKKEPPKSPAVNQAMMGDVAVPMMGAPSIHATQGMMAKPPESAQPAKGTKKPCKWPKRPNWEPKQNPAETTGTPQHPPVIMGKMAAPKDLTPPPSVTPKEKSTQP
jgi:hypothetical protein